MNLVRPLLAATLALAVWAPTAGADANPNNLDCRGHIEAGKPAPGDDDVQVKYVFGCGGPISGYQIQPQLGDTGFDTAASVFDAADNPITTDSFTCQGDFPGWGINCTGKYSGAYGRVIGQFAIAGKLCDEPRVDPLLTVFSATVDAKGVVTPAISGPYDLGRPQGCPPGRLAGHTRIPADGATIGSDAPKKKKKAHHKAKAKARVVRA